MRHAEQGASFMSDAKGALMNTAIGGSGTVAALSVSDSDADISQIIPLSEKLAVISGTATIIYMGLMIAWMIFKFYRAYKGKIID